MCKPWCRLQAVFRDILSVCSRISSHCVRYYCGPVIRSEDSSLVGCTVWCTKIEYPNSEVHVCNCRALVSTTTETTGTTVWLWTLCCLLTTTKTTFTSLKAGCHLSQVLRLSRWKRKSVDNSKRWPAGRQYLDVGVVISDQSVLKCWSARKAVLSEAFVTGGEALGMSEQYSCL